MADKKENRKIKVVLKNKDGKVTRTLVYPEPNAKKIIGFNSGWQLPDDSPYELKEGKFVEKKVTKPTPGQAK